MVAVTGSARGSGEVVAFGEPFPVHPGLVFLVLIGGDLVGARLLRVGVAARAGLGHARGVNRRRRVLDRANIVHAVAIDAGGDHGIPGAQTLSVNAGLVELELIHAFAGSVLAHVVRAAMAGGAEFWDRGARGLTL